MKKIILLVPIFLFQCAPVPAVIGCASQNMYYDLPEIPTSPDGRGATQVA